MCAPCCGKWIECAECHDEKFPDHTFKGGIQMKFTCKNCRKRFDRDFRMFSEKDKFCNFCNVQWCLPAVTPESKHYFECKDILREHLTKVLDPKSTFWKTLDEDKHGEEAAT